MSTEATEIRGIGHSVKRKEDGRLIRGKGTFIDDMQLPGMLYMSILRSPFAHATINGIDTSRAAAVPGVIAVVTGELMAQHNLAWMPTMSGDTVLAELKERFPNVVVIVLTAEGAQRSRAEALGADAFLTKPFSPLELLRTIEQLLEARMANGAAPLSL